MSEPNGTWQSALEEACPDLSAMCVGGIPAVTGEPDDGRSVVTEPRQPASEDRAPSEMKRKTSAASRKSGSGQSQASRRSANSKKSVKSAKADRATTEPPNVVSGSAAQTTASVTSGWPVPHMETTENPALDTAVSLEFAESNMSQLSAKSVESKATAKSTDTYASVSSKLSMSSAVAKSFVSRLSTKLVAATAVGAGAGMAATATTSPAAENSMNIAKALEDGTYLEGVNPDDVRDDKETMDMSDDGSSKKCEEGGGAAALTAVMAALSDSSEHQDQVPVPVPAPSSSKNVSKKKKKWVVAIIGLTVLLAIVIGLGAGLGMNGSIRSSSATSIEDDEDEEDCLETSPFLDDVESGNGKAAAGLIKPPPSSLEDVESSKDAGGLKPPTSPEEDVNNSKDADDFSDSSNFESSIDGADESYSYKSNDYLKGGDGVPVIVVYETGYEVSRYEEYIEYEDGTMEKYDGSPYNPSPTLSPTTLSPTTLSPTTLPPTTLPYTDTPTDQPTEECICEEQTWYINVVAKTCTRGCTINCDTLPPYPPDIRDGRECRATGFISKTNCIEDCTYLFGDEDGGCTTDDTICYPPDDPPQGEDDTNGGLVRGQFVPDKVLGKRSVLVVRVQANDGMYDTAPEIVSNEIFGVGGDGYNLKSGLEACSYGQLQIDRAIPDVGAKIVDGVVTISVPNNISVKDGGIALLNGAIQAINEEFNVARPDELADHVMFCLPEEVRLRGSIAAATIGGWKSWYIGDNCLIPSLAIHELGHNWKLDHANQGCDYPLDDTNDLGCEYQDGSGSMGAIVDEDDGPLRCFNSMNSWFLGWYETKSIVIDPNAEAEEGSCFSGDVYGIDQYEDASTIILEIKTNESFNFFVNFNKKAGINKQTKTGRDKVLVTRSVLQSRGCDSLECLESRTANRYYSELVDKLDVGESWTTSIQDKLVKIAFDSISPCEPGPAQIRVEIDGKACDEQPPPPASATTSNSGKKSNAAKCSKTSKSSLGKSTSKCGKKAGKAGKSGTTSSSTETPTEFPTFSPTMTNFPTLTSLPTGMPTTSDSPTVSPFPTTTTQEPTAEDTRPARDCSNGSTICKKCEGKSKKYCKKLGCSLSKCGL